MADLLSISTERKRRQVEINGTRYDVVSIDELPLGEALAIEDLSSTLSGLSKVMSGNDDVEKGKVAAMIAPARAKLRETIKKFMPTLPDAEAEKLSDMQRLRMVTYFFEKPAGESAPPAKPETAAGPC